MLESSATPNSRDSSRLSSRETYRNVYPLLELDTEATLDVLRCAFAEAEVSQPESSQNSADSSVQVKEESIVEAQHSNSFVQKTVDVLINILHKYISQSDRSCDDGGDPVEEWPSKKEIGYMYEFIAHYVACGKANVPKKVLSYMLKCLTSENFASSNTEQGLVYKKREKQVLAVLKVVPENDWDTSYVLQLCEEARFYQVILLSQCSLEDLFLKLQTIVLKQFN